MDLKYHFLETFEPTILFCGFCGLLGALAAWHYGSINPTLGILAIIGVMFAQMSVNHIDDYEDDISGLDKATAKTKFSGGSFLIQNKLVSRGYVRAVAMISFVLAVLIGLYLIYTNILLLPFALIGGITVLYYARYLSKLPYLSEPLTAFNFFLVSVGCFIAAGGVLGNIGLFAFAAIAAGIQVGIVVIVNYLPDKAPDRKFGRRNVVVMLNSNKRTADLYVASQAASFFLIFIGVALGAIPVACLAVLITVPLFARTAHGIRDYKDAASFEENMADSALAEFAFILLLALAFL